jgi:hypothetical protein
MRSTAALLLLLLLAAAVLTAAQADPLAAEIERWTAFIRGDAGSGEMWGQVKSSVEPLLARAASALKNGRRLLALQRFAVVRVNLEAATSAFKQEDAAAFEARWRREGIAFRDVADVDQIQPAALRALAEIAAPQAKIYYEASLEYSRSTTTESGLFYLGLAHAQKSFLEFARKSSIPTAQKPPALRSLRNELDALERELLAAYRPPISIDKHPEFIVASSMVKEARELEAAGYRYGALLRYLEASRRTAQIRGLEMGRDEASRLVRQYERRFAAENLDHSIGRLFIELADDDPAHTDSVAAAALPRYVAALAPAAPPAAKPKPAVTVTLVRWPYT